MGRAVEVLHDAEVHQQRPSGRRLEQDVVGLHVPVHQAVVVRVLERIEDRLDDPRAHGRPTSGPSARSSFGDGASLQIGHGVVHQALALAHEVDRHRVGVVEAGDGAGLLLEAGDGRRRSRAGRSGGPSPPVGAGGPCPPPRTPPRTRRGRSGGPRGYCRPSARARRSRSRVSLAGRGSRRGDLGAEERQAPRPAPGAMRGALAQQGVAG